MSRRALNSGSAVVALSAVWSIAIQRPSLFVLREFYQFGEFVGITRVHPAPGSRLAGQIMGFNFSEPPEWYAFAARSLAAAVALAPFLLPGLWGHRHITSRGRELVNISRWSLFRGPHAVLVAGIFFAAFDIYLGSWLWTQFLSLGEFFGGTVSRISGQVGIGSRGPFNGDTLADSFGNFAVRHGPGIVCTLVATAAAVVVHTLLWRRDLRRAATGACQGCGYDLRGTPAASPCPECGTARAS